MISEPGAEPVAGQSSARTTDQMTGREPGPGASRDDGATADSRELPLPDNVAWHRVCFVTPLLEGWKIATGVLVFVMIRNLNDFLRAYRFAREHGFSLGGQLGYYLLGLIGLIVLWAGLGLLSWWRRAYAVDADGVYLRSGILSRKLRTARLPRIQSVDVVHPLLGRILGLGRLTVEVAGGRDSRVVIGFLTTHELHALRDRILDLAAGQVEVPAPGAEGPTDPEIMRQRGPGADPASIDEAPVSAHAMAFVTAIARLAEAAAMIALRPPCVGLAGSLAPFGRWAACAWLMSSLSDDPAREPRRQRRNFPGVARRHSGSSARTAHQCRAAR